LPAGKEIGIVDALMVTNKSGRRISHGNNMVWTAIKTCIEKGGIDSSETATTLIIGADYSARAACHAVQSLGAQTIAIVSEESEIAQAIVMDFGRTSSSFDSKHLKIS
jgi:shikimate 5-dehydrogenase